MEREKKREQLRQDALAAWNHYQTTGLHLAAEEADAWLAKLEAGENAPAPECHIKSIRIAVPGIELVRGASTRNSLIERGNSSRISKRMPKSV